MLDEQRIEGHFPSPFGVFYQGGRACYEESMTMQLEETIATKGKGDLDKLLRGRETWTIN
jgi:2-oxoglutarate ferredoxin oxidoreductase subunit beta